MVVLHRRDASFKVLHWPKLFEGWLLVSMHRRFGDGDVSGDGAGGGYTTRSGNGTGDGDSWGSSRGNGDGSGKGIFNGDGDSHGNTLGSGYGRSV